MPCGVRGWLGSGMTAKQRRSMQGHSSQLAGRRWPRANEDDGQAREVGRSSFRIFLIFNPFLINILIITASKKKLHKVARLVAPARPTRLHHVVAPHAPARQGKPRWRACLTKTGVAVRGARPITLATPARQDVIRPRGPYAFSSLSLTPSVM